MSISEFAKKLPDDNTTLSLGYENPLINTDLIAKSSKQKDFIPVGEIIVKLKNSPYSPIEPLFQRSIVQKQGKLKNRKPFYRLKRKTAN